ncbi:MAG: sensor histidine kinase [Desulfopila sp.]
MKTKTTAAAAVPQRLPHSLFGRLRLISLVKALLILAIVALIMHQLEIYNPSNVVAKKLLSKALPALPPTAESLTTFADEFGWDLVVSGPDFFWTSLAEPPTQALLAQKPKADYAFFWVRSVRWLAYRQGDWQVYISNVKIPFSPSAKRIIAHGLLLLLALMFLNNWAIRRLFSPIKALRSGADRIAAGDLEYRIDTTRQDELGALTHSVNSMADRLHSGLEEKRQLLLAMGHELRTPLTRVKLLLAMLPASDDRDQINRNLDAINDLVVTLLDAEALSGGFVALHKEEVEPGDFLADCLVGYPGQIDLKCAVSLPRLQIDRTWMRIVLNNLLGNAFKYGAQQVDVAARADALRIVIAVTDDGIGIDPAIIEKLGQPFYRPDSSRSRKTGGHSLGLYLSRIIIERHGGKLQVENRRQRGTKVWFSLPLERQG